MTDRSGELSAWLSVQRELALLVAHDIRNPLAAVLANLNYLELSVRPGDTDTLSALSDMKQSAEALLRLLDMETTIARLEAVPRIAPDERRPFSPAEALRASIDRFATLTDAAGIRVETQVVGSPRDLAGDRALFEQSIDALIANVMQHVRRGERARFTLLFASDAIVLSLEDDGAAFGEAGRDFGREGQLELKKRSDARYSRGLGLYLVGLATRAIDGTVDTDPRCGHGRVSMRFGTGR
jgi:signal transduction histidine kinase